MFDKVFDIFTTVLLAVAGAGIIFILLAAILGGVGLTVTSYLPRGVYNITCISTDTGATVVDGPYRLSGPPLFGKWYHVEDGQRATTSGSLSCFYVKQVEK